MVRGTGHRNAIRSLWTGRASITVLEGMLDPASGRTEPREREAASELPCRISYKTIKSVEPGQEAAMTAQSVTLFLDPSVEVPEGSRITVTQNGVTRNYGRSGAPAVYSDHQEVPLELWTGKEWA